ncbi:hypothetical protein [Methylocapsa sp. S129]|uniref:hypothetical protein n=1 Tax=Methylocapsa sp. S129 TaxID=1641869 RepID=UPI00131AE0ED|nr:hypothetical protein [Methylocapsa sp. S129]
MPSIFASRRMALAFALSLAVLPGAARAATAIEGDWVGEDDKGRTVRLTVAHSKILQFAVAGAADPEDVKAPRRIKSVRFSRDGRRVELTFVGGRVEAHLDSELLRGIIWDSLGKTAFALGRI